MSNTEITPGAVVTGTYHGLEIIGRVFSMSDWSPRTGILVTVQLDGPITIHGTARDMVCLEIGKLSLVEGCNLPAVAGLSGWRLAETA